MKFLSLIGGLILLANAAQAAPPLFVAKSFQKKTPTEEYDLRWVELTASAIPNEKARKAVNERIREKAMSYKCEKPGKGDHFSASTKAKVGYLDKDMLSVELSHDVMCGGAYPDAGETTHQFELKYGQEQSIYFQMKDEHAFHEFLVEKVLQEAARQKEPGECAENYNKEDLKEAGYYFRVAPGKIVAIQDYPHALLACAFDTEIPIKEVAPFLKEDSMMRSMKSN